MRIPHAVFIFFLMLFNSAAANANNWRGLIIAAENRCSEYDRSDYPYSQSVEDRIIASMSGQIYGPYTGRTFDNKKQTDIEHIVATSEAHDSGLCNADARTRKSFSSDLLNLTLAAPEVNRCGTTGKCGKDAAEWLPARNQCWFAQSIVQIRQKYALTIDQMEARTLEDVLSKCETTDMIFYEQPVHIQSEVMDAPTNNSNALSLYDDNKNGRITCKEAKKHGIAPVHSNHPAYPFMRDGDGDGVVCE